MNRSYKIGLYKLLIVCYESVIVEKQKIFSLMVSFFENSVSGSLSSGLEIKEVAKPAIKT